MSHGGGGDQEVELNIAPIIDCFTVLITYLLVSASFVSLKAIEAGIAAQGPADNAPAQEPQVPPPPPPVALSIAVNANKQIDLHLTGGPEKLDMHVPILPKAMTWDLSGLQGRLDQIKSKWPTIVDTNLSGDTGIVYRDLVSILEVAKKSFPKVFISAG